MAKASPGRFDYEHWQTLERLLTAIGELRQGYRNAPKRGLDEANAAERKIQGLLRNAELRKLLNTQLDGRPPIVVALSRGRLSPTQIKAESELGPRFGYKPGEVRDHIESACREGRLPASIASVDELSAALSSLHADVTHSLDPNAGFRERRRARATFIRAAEERLFGLGVIVADVLRPDLFVISYAVGASRLEVARG